MVRPIAALSALLLLALAGRAHGQERYFQEGRTDTISFNVDRKRNTQQRILIASLFGGTVVFGGVGLLFHIDSKNKADEVSTDSGRHTGRIYSEELDDTRSAAIRSRNFAIASYALGGGLLVGTFIAYLLTDPGQETIHVGTEPDHDPGARLMVAPIEGGALVGGGWRF